MQNFKTTHQFVNQEQLDLGRAGRVWQYFSVVIGGWLSFSILFPALGYSFVWLHHVIALVCFALVYLWFRGDRNSSRQRAIAITYSYLAVHSVGIFSVALTSPELQSSLFALPFGTTIAFMLLGRRASVPWLLVSLLAYVAYPMILYGVEASLSSSAVFVDATLKFGSTLVLFVCLCQFELLYVSRASKLVKLSQGLEALASTDALTGLANRFQVNEEINQALEDAARNQTQLALLVLDMDGFKQINDVLGHGIGDEALVEIASRLTNVVPSETLVGRLGGDEFCVLMRDISSHDAAEDLSRQLHEALCVEYELANVTFSLGASIGVAFYPEDAQASQDLLAFADTAMYHAKENHQAFANYDVEQTTRVAEYRSMQDKLANALERDEFFLVYQPQLDIQSGCVVGAEALLRWQRDGKTISPNEFISHLEANHRITSVTDWVLREVCEQIAEWSAEGLRIKVAVNISAVDFHRPDFVKVVEAAVARSEIDASLLDLEVTEGVLIEDVDAVADKMTRLKETGLTISLDDFGTGFSSLAYIRNLPIDKLKVDREFVKEIPETDDGALVSSIVMLAKTLNFEVLAEGVESKAQLDYLKATECDQFQGYYASRPVSPAKLQEFALERSQLERKTVTSGD